MDAGTPTPRVDALIAGDCKAFPADDLLPALARTLERELAQSNSALSEVGQIASELRMALRMERNTLQKICAERNDALAKREEELREARAAIVFLRRAASQSHMSHLSSARASGCPECIRARELVAQAAAILADSDKPPPLAKEFYDGHAN